MNNLAIFIKERRESLQLSTRKLAELSNVSHSEIHRLENGERRHPSPPLLKDLAKGLSVPYEEIMQAAGYMDRIPSTPVIAPKIAFSDLTEDEQDQVRTFIEFLRSKR